MADALNQYIASLRTDSERRNGQQELNHFIRWCGRDRGALELTPPEIGEYADSAGIWGADSVEKLKPVRSFLVYLKQQGLTRVRLATHLKAPKSKKGLQRVYFKTTTEKAELSPGGLANLQSRLEILKEERIKIVDDIQRAMADKDFKENAPLAAAKERQGMIESSIRDLEGIIATAVVTTPSPEQGEQRVRLGRQVTLKEVGSGKQVKYTLVDSREADPMSGKISSVSPVGRALLDKVTGEEVRITVPRGTLHYVIKKIEG